MFRNMKVGLRLTLGFLLMLAFMIAIIVISMLQAQVSHEQLQNIVKINNVREHLAHEMIDGARQESIVIRRLMLSKYGNESSESIKNSIDEITKLRKEYIESAAKIKEILSKEDTIQLDLLKKLEESATAARQLQDKAIELAMVGKLKEASNFLRGKTYPAMNRWIDEVDNLIQHNKKRTLLRYNEAEESAAQARTTMLILGAVALSLSVLIVLLLSMSITKPLNLNVIAANQIASGNLSVDLSYAEKRGDELGVLAQSFSKMVVALRNNQDFVQRQDWLKTGIARLNQVMSGDPDLATLASKVISEISTYLEAQMGAIYLAGNGEGATLSLMGSYAYTKRKNLSNVFQPGEGLVGQAVLEKKQILIRNVPEDYIKVTSALGELIPRFICVSPLIYEDRVKGVIEVGTLGEITDQQMEYLNQATPALALAVESADGRMKLAKSLEESQAMTEELRAQQEELQTQQEELRTTNEELEEQTQALKVSEEKLRVQQEELQVTNEELEEKNELLDRQKRDVEKAKKDIEEQSAELALASKYKSEFLANMSHELRTPLNSLLLLSQMLSENKAGNLTEEQVESAKIIHGSGSDLLNLINEILDLSKIEAGRMDLQLGAVQISDLADSIRATFGHMAEEKGLKLEVAVRDEAPAEITSDRKRIEQVIRNLTSNAIKFTHSGSVTVIFSRPSPNTNLSKSGLSAGDCLAVEVKDTGIGIAPENQKIIFEAFQQVDGGTSRKYAGTGLGLSISRELARLLGGEIQVESYPGKGSTFTFYLSVAVSSGRKVVPGDTATVTVARGEEAMVRDVAKQSAAALQIEDDRENLKKGERVMLIIEDDPNFARILYKICHDKGFKCLAAATGEAGLELADKHLPSAVILDIYLPGMDGWAVLTALKENTSTRHIPVHIISAEEASKEALRKGAVGHATKPISREDIEKTFRRLEQASAEQSRRVLVVEDDPNMRHETAKLLGNKEIKVDEAGTGKQALELLRSGRYDCVVLDLGLPDMSGGDLLEQLEHEGVELPPVIVYTAGDLTLDEEENLRGHAESIVIKDVRSQERLLDEVSLFLHRVVSQMPEKQRKIIRDLHNAEELLLDKKVLIVDDDMRTTFAMSRLLSERGMKTLKAENGEKALKLLDEQPDVDIVLMDIMMPVMDGYETMKHIRSQERFRRLPIIALTAKAMPEDREKCVVAGANDYLPKPVDQKRLASMMRVWLCR